MVPDRRVRACDNSGQVSAPFQLVPASRPFLPVATRAPHAVRSWPAPEGVAVRRSNTWPAPSLDTMAWAESAFDVAPSAELPAPLLRLPVPADAPVATVAPLARPPLPAPAAFAAPLARAVLRPPTPFAPPEPASAAAPTPLAAPPADAAPADASRPHAASAASLLLAPPTVTPPAPARRPLPEPVSSLAPPTLAPAPAPAPTPPAPHPGDTADRGRSVDDATADDRLVIITDDTASVDVAPARSRRPIVRLQDAIITLSVAAATALITLVLLSQL